MVDKIIFWLVLLAIEFVCYPSAYEWLLQITGDSAAYYGNTFMNWPVVLSTLPGIQTWLAFNIVVIIIVIIQFAGKSSLATEADTEGAYGTARFATSDELNAMYPTYKITPDQKFHKGLYKITQRFKTSAEAKRWMKKK